ncbi:M4 family metallopeptidase [Oceanobacillus massiliensis]|uniref:M4 family metallopeptidase n=1 Tax=Oceanobacillus massiliensis TaxID=1465765 RepID=UPI000288291B|nr:M4 family metallopeptidase [Oceanobacillus massiliensis]
MKKHNLIPVILSSAIIAGSFPASNVLAAPIESSSALSTQAQKAWNEKANVPLFVKEKISGKQTASNEENAVAYLKENKEKTGIERPQENLKVKDIQKDNLGMTHIRFQQTKNDVPIEGAEVIVHFNKDNAVVAVNGHYNHSAEGEVISKSAAVSVNDAVKAAKSAVEAPLVMSYDPTTDLIAYPFDGKTSLAYKVNLTFLGDEPGNWFVFVDANTGEIIDKYNALLHADELKKKDHKGIGEGVHGNLREIHTTKEVQPGLPAVFKLYDESHQGLDGIYTYDHPSGEIFENRSSSWKDEYQAAAVDAHYNSEMVYDYYMEEHGRNSLDGNGMAIISYVHYGDNYNNAFWNGRNMTYGDGDGEFMVSLSAGLDVAAHEMTHGVITNSANLQYRNQSGALNESFADIFGALVDEDDWEMGEDIMAPASQEDGRTALRSLSNPSKFPVSAERAPYGNGMYPAHMDDFYDMPANVDNGGVHVNSSITNHAAYLIGEQIGKEKLGQVYYRALTVYLTPTSDFSDARNVLIQSAVDIYGEDSTEAEAVANGFDQVGIY